MNTIIGIIFLVLSIAANLADIYTTWQGKQAGLVERNKLFREKGTMLPDMKKVIVLKGLMLVATIVVAAILYFGFDAAYFAFFPFIGIFFVNGVTAYNNYKLLNEHRKKNTPKM